jgi:hypothetical protein
MIMGVILKAGKEIDRGIMTGGSHYVEEYPEQEISICSQCDAYDVKNKRTYKHENLISFLELQDNGNGWEVVYDSREGVDRTVEYDLPRWFWDANASIPNVRHTMKGKDIEAEHRGYIR